MARTGLILAIAALAAVSAAQAQAGAGPVTLYATQPGKPALDADPHGGNPFATALISALERPGEDPKAVLRTQTLANSGNEQQPDLGGLAPGATLAPDAGEQAIALVLVFADYGSDLGLISLPGAAFDAARVTAALQAAGYATEMVIARDAAQYRASLAEFRETSAAADRALVYTTGHGVEAGATVYLVAPDFERLVSPRREDISITLPEVAAALQARDTNLLVYAGCRDNPLEW